MKKIYLMFIVFALTVSIESCKKKSPVEYNNSIIQKQVEIVTKIDELKKSIDNYVALDPDVAVKEMDIAYKNAVSQIDTGLNFIDKLEDFKGDNTLKKGAEDLFKSYKSIMETEYIQIIELYKKPDDLFSTEDSERLEELLSISNEKLNASYDEFLSIQKEFATKNNLTVE